MTHAIENKKKQVTELVNKIKNYPVIGIINMANLPALQLQKIRAELRDKVFMKMVKKNILKLALEQLKTELTGLEGLEGYMKDTLPAIIMTKENPFSLSKMLQKSKSSAPAKPGQTAPSDIVVKAGPTSFAPGPIISELASVGIKSGVEAGKVAVKADSVVAKKGDIIKPVVASVLTRLGIEPMEIGLDLVAVYEDGQIFAKDILEIDEEQYIDNITNAAKWAFNLAIEACYLSNETTEILVTKAFNEAKTVALEFNIISDLVLEQLAEKAERQALNLKQEAKIETVEKPKEKKKPEEKKEEKPEEKKKPEEKPVEKKPKEGEKTTEQKVAEMAKEAHEFAEGKKAPSAQEVIEEVKKEQKPAPEKSEEKVPSAYELAKAKEKSGKVKREEEKK